MVNLKVVIPGKTLFWPDRYGWQEKQRVRGVAGYVVDLDAPMELGHYGEGNKAVDGFCVGQEYKLADAPPGSKVGDIVNPLVLRDLRELARAKAGETPEAVVDRKASAERIMEPDLPPSVAAKAAEAERVMTAGAILAGKTEAPFLAPTAEDVERFGATEPLEVERPAGAQEAPAEPQAASAGEQALEAESALEDSGDAGDEAPEVMDPDPAPKPKRRGKTGRVQDEDGLEG
jgi:hypothetical protein